MGEAAMSGTPLHVPEMDYLRAFAILAVLAIHVSAGFTAIPAINSLMIVNVIIDIFTHYAVPLFIFISGFVLYLKYNRNYSARSFAKKRFLRIIPPYLIFTTFYLLFGIFKMKILTGIYEWPSTLQILYAYFAAGASYHMWFFLIIIELYLLYPVIIRCYHFFADRNYDWLFVVLALILQLGWQVFGANYQLHLAGYDLDITNKLFLCRFFYFALGIYVCSHYAGIKEWVLKRSWWVYGMTVIPLTLICSYILLSGVYVYGNYSEIPNSYMLYEKLVLSVLLYVCTFALLYVLCHKIVSGKKQATWLLTIGAYSFGIFLIHPFFQQGIMYLLEHIGITKVTAMYYPVVFLSVLICSIIFVWIMQKIPGHKYIIG